MRKVMILALLGMVAASCGQNIVGYDTPQDAGQPMDVYTADIVPSATTDAGMEDVTNTSDTTMDTGFESDSTNNADADMNTSPDGAASSNTDAGTNGSADASTGNQTDGNVPQCTNNDDCAYNDTICNNGYCQPRCGADDDCTDEAVCTCVDEECSKGSICVSQDPSCHDADPECATTDPYDNHCNGRGHYVHGNGNGYGHCHHHRHTLVIPRAEKCVLDSDCAQRQKCRDEECVYLLPPFPDSGW